MEELHDSKNRVEQHEEANKQQEIRFLGTTKRPHKGMKMFEFNPNTGDCQPVDFDFHVKVNVSDSGHMGTAKKATVETSAECIYFWALNQKNAAKKLFKQGLITSIIRNDT